MLAKSKKLKKAYEERFGRPGERGAAPLTPVGHDGSSPDFSVNHAVNANLVAAPVPTKKTYDVPDCYKGEKNSKC